MDLRVDNDVRMARPPTHAAALPPLPGVALHEPAVLDRVGVQVSERWPLLLAAAAGGGVAGALIGARAGHGLLGRMGAALAGAAGFAAAAIATSTATRAIQSGAPFEQSEARRAGATTADTHIQADEQLRVMTFNAHLGKGERGSELGTSADMERLAVAIEREDPDVVLLQEVDRFAVHNGFRDMLAELNERLGADGAAYAPSTRNVTGRESGTAVLTFNGVQVADARSIISPDVHGDGVLRRVAGALDTGSRVITEAATGTAREPFGTTEYRPRATADVLVTTPAGTAVRVLSGHWSWPSDGVDHPARQVYPLAGLIDAWDGPTIVGGDFNVRSDSPRYASEAQSFADAGMRDAFTAAGVPQNDDRRNTFGSGEPHAPIDRIYGSDRLRVERVHVSPFPANQTDPSDHHPLVVDYGLVAEDR